MMGQSAGRYIMYISNLNSTTNCNKTTAVQSPTNQKTLSVKLLFSINLFYESVYIMNTNELGIDLRFSYHFAWVEVK